jgi:hypothetical protein
MNMKEISSATKLARLSELLNKAGELLFERITLASELMKDADWIAEGFNGNQDRAANMLEKKFLGDLCGAIQFWRLIALRDRFKTIEEWREKDFNLTVLSAIYDKETKKNKNKREINRVTLKEYEELLKKVANLEHQLKTETKLREQAEAKLEVERKRVETAIREKAEAVGRAAELQRQIELLTQRKSA